MAGKVRTERNPRIIAMLRKAFMQVKQGKIVRRGSFAKYAK